MADTQTSTPSARPWKRFLKIGIPLFVLVAVAVVVFWPRIQIRLWISALHAEDLQAVAAARQHLVESRREGVDETLEGVMLDTSASFRTRTRVAEILLARQRLPVVERALRSDDLEVRKAPLAVLEGQTWFESTYLHDPAWKVQETALAWLRQADDENRGTAIALAERLELEESLPALREILRGAMDIRPSPGPKQTLMRAAQAVVMMKDCESMRLLVEPAEKHPDDLVRLRLMQALVRGVVGPQPTCEGAVPEERVRDIVLGNLLFGTHTRAGALVALRDNPSWAKVAEERLQTLLDDRGMDSVPRRQALAALAATGSPAFGEVLPRYFHDPDRYVRSEATSAAIAYADGHPLHRYEGCLIGVVRSEVASATAFQVALGGLHDAAKRWVGLPPTLSEAEASKPGVWNRFRDDMFLRGESQGLSRVAWAEAWMRWFAADLGLGQEDVDRAMVAWNAFWDAVHDGDVAAARAALEGAPGADGDLFLNERAWLETR